MENIAQTDIIDPHVTEFDWREKERERERETDHAASNYTTRKVSDVYVKLSPFIRRVAASFLSDDFVLRETNQATLIHTCLHIMRKMWRDMDG